LVRKQFFTSQEHLRSPVISTKPIAMLPSSLLEKKIYIHTTLAAQFQKNKQPNQKMGQRTK